MFRRFRYFGSPPSWIPPLYFENWNVFDPRNVSPPSIDVCKAEIAVITPITEKIPIEIPEIVNAERSLLAPRELQAILTISRINMVIRIAKLQPDSDATLARQEQNLKLLR